MLYLNLTGKKPVSIKYLIESSYLIYQRIIYRTGKEKLKLQQKKGIFLISFMSIPTKSISTSLLLLLLLIHFEIVFYLFINELLIFEIKNANFY